MMKPYSWRESGEIHKVYEASQLLDPLWPSRIVSIERITKKYPYPTRFTVDFRRVIRSMRIVRNNIRTDKISGKYNLKKLCRYLDDMHSEDIVHGDLNWKNIAWDGHCLVILDWEPSLRQMVGYRSALMATMPFVHPSDVAGGRLSRLTDLMCLFRLAVNLDPTTSAELASMAAHKKTSASALEFALDFVSDRYSSVSVSAAI